MIHLECRIACIHTLFIFLLLQNLEELARDKPLKSRCCKIKKLNELAHLKILNELAAQKSLQSK